MRLESLLNYPKKIIIYAGRFCPMHPGHYGVYLYLVEKFGVDNVYIASINKQSDVSPFSFSEKKEIATKMFNIPEDKFVFTKQPYRPVEILDKFNPNLDIFITALGSKDADRFKDNKYFLPLENNIKLNPFIINGYVCEVPEQENGLSASKIREFFKNIDNLELKKKFFEKVYSKFNQDIFSLFIQKLS